MASGGQSWFSNEVGKYLSNDTLSRKLRAFAQPTMRYRQFVERDQQFGKRSGQRLLFDKRTNLSSTGSDGALIPENEPIPRDRMLFLQGTVTAYESGRGVGWSELFQQFSEFETRDPISSALGDHMARALNYRAYNEGFNLGKIVYTPTGSDIAPTFYWSITGTAGAAASRDAQVLDLKNIVDAMREGVYGSGASPTGNNSAPAEFWDGANMVAIGSVSWNRAIKDDPEYERAQYYGDPEKLFSGETGRIYATRNVEDNHIARRINGYGGEVTIIGADAVMEVTVTGEEIREALPADFGRDMAMAWYYLGGSSPIWSYGTTSGDATESMNSIVRVRST